MRRILLLAVVSGLLGGSVGCQASGCTMGKCDCEHGPGDQPLYEGMAGYTHTAPIVAPEPTTPAAAAAAKKGL